MDQINHKELRQLLKFFSTELLASQTEIAQGADISRPNLNKFIKEGGKLPMKNGRDSLIKLHKYLSNNAPSDKIASQVSEDEEERQKKKEQAKEYRELLKKLSPDEFLEAAGYLPKNANRLRVSPTIYQIMVEIEAMLEIMEVEDALYSTLDFKSILYDKLRKTSNKLFPSEKIKETLPEEEPIKKDYLGDLINILMKKDTSTLPLGLKERFFIKKKLEKAYEKLKKGGKKEFTQQEALSLFLSIAVKEKSSNHLIDLSIRLEKIEYQTLSSSIEFQQDYQNLYNKIFNDIAREEEFKLAGYDLNKQDSCSNQNPQQVYDNEPVLLARLTCFLKYNDRPLEKVQFIYTSSNTPLENAIAAIGIHLGFNQELEGVHFVSTKVLDSQINGLVETTVILKDGEHRYQSTWVDRDTIKTQLQAIISAAIHWIDHTSKPEDSKDDNHSPSQLDLDLYKSILIRLSEIRTELFDLRQTFQNFRFLDDQCNTSNISEISKKAMDQLQEIPCIKKVDELRNQFKISQDENEKCKIKNQLKKINKTDIYLPYRKNLIRCFFQFKLILVRKANTQGDIRVVKCLIDELQSVLDDYPEWLEDDFLPMKTLLDAERYLYELSSGEQEYVFVKNAKDKENDLELTVTKLTTIIKNSKFYKDPGMDIYHSLSEIYGNIARLNFYLSDEKSIIEEARNNFLKAAYHASRIGANPRTARWIALAGRACIRLGEQALAQEAIELSTAIIRRELNTQYKPIFQDALLSETNLLRGEYHFIRLEYEEALFCFLRSLKGAAYLGFNRRLTDVLFNLSRCSQRIGNKTLESVFSSQYNPFQEFMTNNGENFQLEIEKIHSQGNPASATSLRLLNELLQDSKNKQTTWANVADRFLTEAKNIWKKWHDDSVNESDTKHPVVTKLEEGKWLTLIE